MKKPAILPKEGDKFVITISRHFLSGTVVTIISAIDSSMPLFEGIMQDGVHSYFVLWKDVEPYPEDTAPEDTTSEDTAPKEITPITTYGDTW